MVGGDQSGRSSRPLSASQKKKLRNRLRKLDKKCERAWRIIQFRRMFRVFGFGEAERIYQRADMERMMTRNLIKGYHNGNKDDHGN